MNRLRNALRRFARGWSQTARLMVGQPDYEAYLRHFSEAHPELEPLSRRAFFDNRMKARYGQGGGRCC